MNITFIFVISIFILSSCTYSDIMTQSYNTGTVTEVTTGTINSGGIDYQAQVITGAIKGGIDYQATLVEDLSWSGDVYYPIFRWLEPKVIRIKHHSRIPTKILFMNSEAKSIEVLIVFPNSTVANLRLSQIVLPNGIMDGPFWQKTGYNLAQLGGYQLIFNENMMAGEPWSGEAIITLTLGNSVYEQNAVLLK